MTNLIIRTSVLKRNLFQKLSSLGSSMINQSWLIKPLEEKSNDLKSSPEDINVNSASIEEIPNPVPLSGKGKRTPKLDFPLGL